VIKFALYHRIEPVPTPRTVLWWAYPPQTKLQAHKIEVWNTIKHWGFTKISECQALLHKRKAPILKTFWPWFWIALLTNMLTLIFQCVKMILFQLAKAE